MKTELKSKEFIDPFRKYDLLLKFQEKEYNAQKKEMEKLQTQQVQEI